jgi:hypothetical protein
MTELELNGAYRMNWAGTEIEGGVASEDFAVGKAAGHSARDLETNPANSAAAGA